MYNITKMNTYKIHIYSIPRYHGNNHICVNNLPEALPAISMVIAMLEWNSKSITSVTKVLFEVWFDSGGDWINLKNYFTYILQSCILVTHIIAVVSL